MFWLDTSALLLWGALLLKYWISGQIYYLLHPDYIWLAVSAGFSLLVLASWQLVGFFARINSKRLLETRANLQAQHITVLPTGFGSGLLVAIACLGLLYTPRPFASDIALQRGVTDTLAMTRSQPQSFQVSNQPEDRSLLDWIRTINVYPEPDAYMGDPVSVEGFVVYPPELPEGYLMISRFIITCCAADAYPVGLPVKVEGDRTQFPEDKWFRVQGTMMTEELNGQRQLVINGESLESIPTPRNPYDT
ncbi:MAG: TIGR03943 family protein [Leptolyngbyaceae bacterium]|nr:TIGR03943 family protein [Leptolyngbyaceae bacterium]